MTHTVDPDAARANITNMPVTCPAGCGHDGARWSDPAGYVVFREYRDGRVIDVAYATGPDAESIAETVVRDVCTTANTGAYPGLREVYMTGIAPDDNGVIHRLTDNAPTAAA